MTNNFIEGSFQEGEILTLCGQCGWQDYWAYGFYESSSYIESKCETYSYD